MKPRILAAVASVPVVSYAVVLSAAFIITAASGTEPISVTSEKMLMILMKSASLPIFAIYVVSLIPAFALPFLVNQDSRKKSPSRLMTVVCWIVATGLVSIIPSIFSVIVADYPAQGLMMGFGSGFVSVVVFAVICSAANEAIENAISTQPMGVDWAERHAKTGPDSFGKRGVT